MTAQDHEMMRNATSRLLAQLMPTPGGLASLHWTMVAAKRSA